MMNDEPPARMGRGVANQHAAATSGRIGGHDDSRHGTQQAARTRTYLSVTPRHLAQRARDRDLNRASHLTTQRAAQPACT